MDEIRGGGKVVCVTGGSGYIGSWLVRKLLARGYIVHATLRNLEDKSKVGLLKSLPKADTNLVLFQADVNMPEQLEPAISGCEFVFHVALPISFEATCDQLQGYTESIVAGVRIIAELCIRSGSVRRLIYTGSVVSISPLNDDGAGYKSTTLNESLWTPTDLPLSNINDYMLAYMKSKTMSEKVLLRFNEMEGSKLEVVSLACANVGGETLLPYVPLSLKVVVSQIMGDPVLYLGLKFLEELLGTVPLVHIDDVCDAHIFCMEKTSMRGRFLCAAASLTTSELTAYMRENHSDFKISEEFMGQSRTEGSTCIDNSRLKEMGFEYKYDLKRIIDDSVACGQRLGAL